MEATLLNPDGTIAVRLRMDPMKPWPPIIKHKGNVYKNMRDGAGTYKNLTCPEVPDVH
jgi:hypothetical protein